MENYCLTEPIFLRNLVIFPIKATNGSSRRHDAHNGFDPSTLDEVLAQRKAEIRELETPGVNEIIFENRGDWPVLLLDGEEITGSLQNRIIAASHLVAARSTEDVAVVCVEEGRWDELGGFQTGYCSYPRIRSILAKGMHKKTDTQKIIWDEINRKLTVTKTLSKTSSMHDIYDNLKEEIARYVEGFESLNHSTVGFIGVAGDRILGCDIFFDSNIYRKFENKLIRSYALDAFEYQRTKKDLPDVETFFANVLGALKNKKIKKSRKTIPIKGNEFLGQTLTYNTRLVHLSAFPT